MRMETTSAEPKVGERYPTVFIEPWTREALQGIGRALPIQSFADFFGYQPRSIAAFSDYGGTASGLDFETFVTYLIDWEASAPLMANLAAVRRRYGLGSRRMHYKKRKDERRSAAMHEWMAAFRDQPGLCVAICWDRRISQTPGFKQNVDLVRRELNATLGLSFPVAIRLTQSLGFLAVVGHLLRPENGLLWASDEDEVFAGTAGVVLKGALHALANQVVGVPLRVLGYCRPTSFAEPNHPLVLGMADVLSLPDLVAGSLAATLSASRLAGPAGKECDDATRVIIEAVADFPPVGSGVAAAGRLLVITFRLLDDGSKMCNSLKLSRIQPGDRQWA